MGSRSPASSLVPKNEVREVTADVDQRTAGRGKRERKKELAHGGEESGMKMSGLDREELLGEGKPSPWSGKFWVEGRLCQPYCVSRAVGGPGGQAQFGVLNRTSAACPGSGTRQWEQAARRMHAWNGIAKLNLSHGKKNGIWSHVTGPISRNTKKSERKHKEGWGGEEWGPKAGRANTGE